MNMRLTVVLMALTVHLLLAATAVAETTVIYVANTYGEHSPCPT